MKSVILALEQAPLKVVFTSPIQPLPYTHFISEFVSAKKVEILSFGSGLLTLQDFVLSCFDRITHNWQDKFHTYCNGDLLIVGGEFKQYLLKLA